MNTADEVIDILLGLIADDPDGWDMKYMGPNEGWQSNRWFWHHTATNIIVAKGESIEDQGRGSPFTIGMDAAGYGGIRPTRRQRKRFYHAFIDLRGHKILRAIRRVTG